ncbi:hypothetical protein ABW20_dc0104438 [Dactylellina cionopaga]|nr:hypothetical protein ABW20_dc0104438 [Dactylellina cionopaga]
MSSGHPPFAGRGHAPPAPLPLPKGWTEHRAPSGHVYFYHAESKTSEWTRPVAPPAELPFAQPPSQPPAYQNPAFGFQNPGFPPGAFNYNRQQHGSQMQKRPRPQEKPDKPKTKRAIPNAEPWLFVTTRKGNTFVHNPETKESLWAVPDDLKDAIENLEKLSLGEEREKERIRRRESALEKQRKEQEEAEADRNEFEDPSEYLYEPEEGEGDAASSHGVKRQVSATVEGDEGEEEYYDDEDFEDEHAEKRMRLEQGGPVEFTEEDIAWQLGAMAEDYGLDEEDGNEDFEVEDGVLLFKDLLNDLQINPYSTWETEMLKLVDDGRYTALTTTKLRKQVFSDWCQERIAVIKAEKSKEVKRDPRIAFLNFIELNASTKLYWPEFKRKYKKEPELKDPKVTDKDREKYYREYLSRIKTSVETRENDLRKYLKTVKDLTRQSTVDDLPSSVACDIRFVAVPKDRREPIVEAHIRSLPDDAGMAAGLSKDSLEKQRRALQDREEAVRREQFYNRKEIARGKDALRETEMEIKRAMNVSREGLLTHLEPMEEKDADKDTEDTEDKA